MSNYPEVVGQLVSAAVGQGMSARTQVIAVADGAIGLREVLEAQFPNLTFILDPTGSPNGIAVPYGGASPEGGSPSVGNWRRKPSFRAVSPVPWAWETSCKDWTHRPHLKQHLYEGAEAIGLTGLERHKWVSDLLHLIDAGDVRKVIRTLLKYWGQGQKRIASLLFASATIRRCCGL